MFSQIWAILAPKIEKLAFYFKFMSSKKMLKLNANYFYFVQKTRTNGFQSMLFRVLTNCTNPQTEPHTDIATCTLNRPSVKMGLPIAPTRLFIYVFVRLSHVGRNPISSAGDNSFCE